MYTSEGSQIKFTASPNKPEITYKMQCIPKNISLSHMDNSEVFNQKFWFFTGGATKMNFDKKNGAN